MALKDLISLVTAEPLNVGHPLLEGLTRGMPPKFMETLKLRPARNLYTHPDSTVVAFYAKTPSGRYMAFKAPVSDMTKVTPIVAEGSNIMRRWEIRTYAQDACRRLVADHITPTGSNANECRNNVSFALRSALLTLTGGVTFEDFTNDMVGMMVERLFRQDLPVNAETLIHMAGAEPGGVGRAIARRIAKQQIPPALTALLDDLAFMLGEGDYLRELYDGKLGFRLVGERLLRLESPLSEQA